MLDHSHAQHVEPARILGRKRVLLTGLSGFVGSHVGEHLLDRTDWDIVGIVSFKHKGCPLRIHDGNFDKDRVKIVYHDLQAPISDRLREAIGPIDLVINVASDSHVDRSILDPVSTITNNTALMLNMLEYARVAKPKVFLQVSTDEVYGPADWGKSHPEWDTILPSNPYSASKAAQEAIAFAYWRTYGVPLLITNTMNIFGERQDPEKFVPMVISKLLKHETIEIHAGPDGISGSRFYLHARNQADALLFLLVRYGSGVELLSLPMYPTHSRPARFNVVGDREMRNLEMAQMINHFMERPTLENIKLVNFHSSRPGHDLRYALDGSKLQTLGWHPPVEFTESLQRTVDWTLNNREWLL